MRKFFFGIIVSLLYTISAFGQCSTTAKFGYTYVGCSVIQFTDSSTTSATSTVIKRQWYFGDGDSATGKQVTHTYTPGTSVTVKLVVTAQDTLNVTCQSTITKNINLPTLPTVNIASNPNPGCLNDTIQFEGTSNHPIKSWQWIFGDGDTANIQNPAHHYADTLSYPVSLYVVDSSGCSNHHDTIQKIKPLPTVNFTWSPDPASTVDNIQFAGTSNATANATTMAWRWNFGDGDTAFVQNPTHSYSAFGQYNTTLTITVDSLCSNSVTRTVPIDPLPAPDFSYSVSCLHDMTYFSDSSTTPVGTIQTWKWYFGDGDSTIINSPNNPNTTHIYVTQATYPVTLVTINSDGYQRSITKNVTVVPKPTASFTFNDTCYTNPTSFYDQSLTNGGSAINKWHWTFGDNDSASVQDPMHTYAYPGSYPVTLYIQNADGCKDTVQRTLVMDTLPAVDFTMSADTICQGQSVTFLGQASNIHSWLWNFGNGQTSTYDSITEPFTTPGTDTITLTVKDLKGCSSSVYHTIFVKPRPAAGFIDTILCKGDTTCFWDQSSIDTSAYIASYNWNFGDNGSSTLQNPDHYYVDQTKNYNATLTVTSNQACSSSATRLIIFDSLPVPQFADTNACMNDETHFTDKSTSPGISYITTRKWYFGDGDSLIVTDPNISTADHIYKATTTYAVKLIVENSFGKTDSITRVITVHKKPLADFTFNDTCFTKPITFIDSSKRDGGAALSAWNWNFGDPSSGTKDSSSLENPTHAMTNPGNYMVSLIVSNTDGCSDTAYKNVVVDSLPNPSFTVSKDTICFGDRAYFYGNGKNIISWHWNFGDDSTSSYQDPSHKYLNPGTYVVMLTVKDMKGCSNFVIDTVFVDDRPKAAFTIGPSCVGDSTYFSDNSNTIYGPNVQWQWNFGDTASGSNQSSAENPAHHFTGVGTYTTKLVVTDIYGCSDSISHFVNVYAPPKAAFSYHQACDPATRVDFTDQSVRSSSNSPIVNYLWTFYEADTSTLQDPSYRFPHYDSCYQVTLMVTDTNGCHNTDTMQVCLRDSLTADFTMTKVCLGNPTAFTASYNPNNDSIASYTWNFGDGSAEVVTYHDTVSHVFPRPGTYNVVLSAVDTNGCSVSITHQAVVDSLPQPDFTDVTPNCDQPTSFQGPVKGGGSFISNWQWNFGDVNSGTNDTSSMQNPSHLYPSLDSTYQVKLIVKNFNGCVDSVTKPVKTTTCLHVLYTVSTSTGCANNPVYFRDHTSLSASNGTINEWDWDFGDGTTKTYTAYKDSILHVYNSQGIYHVVLNIKATVNNMPVTGTYDSIIKIYRPPVANFGYNNSCANLETTFIDSTKTFDAALSQWQWTFNDPYDVNDSSGLQNPTHLYDSAGTYPVQLVVTDNNNCRDTVTKPVTMYSSPVAAFTVTQNYNNVTGQVLLNNLSTGASQYLWDFGDGNSSTETSPVYQYQSVGIFKILLTATNDNMCSDTASSYIDLTSGLFVPNSFAPNSEHAGVKVFKPKGINLKEYDIRVFNMWGDLLWESTKLNAKGEPTEGWNGTYKGQPIPEGDYIWRIEAKFLDGSTWKGSDNGDGNKKPYGTVFLIR